MGFQCSLATTKQDAVDMMLCLKSLMDSKINDTETRNLLHAITIQELESQLEKAKSIILSLQSICAAEQAQELQDAAVALMSRAWADEQLLCQRGCSLSLSLHCLARLLFILDELGKETAEIAVPAALALPADLIASLLDTAFISYIGFVKTGH